MGSRPLILDTHVLVWLFEGHDELGPRARSRIDEALAESRLGVSAVTFWELGMLVGKGRLALATPVGKVRERLLQSGLVEVPLDGDLGIAATALEGLHDDPADRMIVATVRAQGGTLLTADRRLLEWQGPLRTLDARR